MPDLNFTYGADIDVAVPGAIADMRGKTLISRTVEGAALAFGKPVAQGTTDATCRLTTTGDTAVFAISVLDRSVMSDDEFKVGESARLMTEGPVWVTAVAAVNAGDPVHVIVADGTFTNIGGVAFAGARYETSAAADGLALVAIT